MNITPKQYKNFSDLVYHGCGINLHEGKQQLLKARLAKRLRRTGIDSVDEYLKVLKNDPQEKTAFFNAISTNHTFFFRESGHFDMLDSSHHNIWCAASSSGEEPYSIAIHCLENGWQIQDILATDISTEALEMGEKGVYPMERAKNVPPHILKKYFKKGHGNWEGYIRVRKNLRRMVKFKRINLLYDVLPLENYDAIFCRNVFIYFDNVTKEGVISRLYDSIKNSGYFIIGGAESLNNLNHPFKYIKPSIYKKELNNI